MLKKPNNKECQGEEREIKQCHLDALPKTDQTMSAGFGGLLWVVISFLVVTIVGLLGCIIWERKRPRKDFRQMPPYSVVANQYSSLPTKDVSGGWEWGSMDREKKNNLPFLYR